MQSNLQNIIQAIPQVLNVLGTVKPENLEQYMINLCKSQNIPLEQAINQARGIVNMLGGEENARKFLNQFGLKI